jgi:Formate hydrogenlyase subunit 4
MINMKLSLLSMVLFIVIAPFLGGLLHGIDRKITARMQGRKGPSVLQAFYDVIKLFEKQMLYVDKMQNLLLLSYLFFIIFTGALFFAGVDMLLCFFALSTAEMFFILAATVTHSPFTYIGSQRELMQMMAYEPMILLTAVGFYQATGSFKAIDIIQESSSPIILMPGFFIGFVFILAIKFRKSPFDISTSHHAHQELVKGVTTEMTGTRYAWVEIAEWYEEVFLLAIVALFIINNHMWSWFLAAAVIVLVYFLEILIDNTCARVKWDLMLKSTWIVSLVAGGLNLLILEIIN